MSSNKTKKKYNLIKRAYVLGYEVGYYSHDEAVGWVKKELRKIEQLARAEGIEKEIEKVYKRGKDEGRRKRSYEITEGKEKPMEQPSIRVERNTIRLIRRYELRMQFMDLPRFLRRRNQF
ncbi:hypothetical protein AciM339_0054 [Aciduliprofundum sp. MAR08-339]|uniref:hypothetical protein n=1 Tax=Aciduliprofundum sp. (strain MAR08-339) TaxID=673860 RepID=UPI0002A4AB26|nr:hypothetical protein AciM339_0054 [Aciduliprofundum sp. MAR08-339]